VRPRIGKASAWASFWARPAWLRGRLAKLSSADRGHSFSSFQPCHGVARMAAGLEDIAVTGSTPAELADPSHCNRGERVAIA